MCPAAPLRKALATQMGSMRALAALVALVAPQAILGACPGVDYFPIVDLANCTEIGTALASLCLTNSVRVLCMHDLFVLNRVGDQHACSICPCGSPQVPREVEVSGLRCVVRWTLSAERALSLALPDRSLVSPLLQTHACLYDHTHHRSNVIHALCECCSRRAFGRHRGAIARSTTLCCATFARDCCSVVCKWCAYQADN